MVNSCSHAATAEPIPEAIYFNFPELVCADCDCKGPNLWICLYKDCFQIGCTEKSNDHSTLHNLNNPSHCIHMNLSTKRIWCYQCKKEVYMEHPLYIDSDQEESFKGQSSGRGSYSTLRTNTSDKAIFSELSIGNVGMSGDASDSSDIDEYNGYNFERPSGLVGLQNIGNTCYMNAALQALSNTEPLTKFFLECPYIVQILSEGKKPGLSRTYQTLMRDIWIKKVNQGYVTPSGILYGIRNVHAMFRGYQQHDTQEFLRNFMDQLHEELKQVYPPEHAVYNDTDTFSLAMEEPTLSSSYDSSEGEYETCDSGVSERSSLSDDTERPVGSTKRRFSRCSSPNRRQRQRIQSSSVIDSQPSTNSSTNLNHPPKKQTKYRSIISDIFDGKLLSSVQCLTCDRISSRVETFQDLSLPIPSRDHLVVLHGRSAAPGATCSDAVLPAQDGWIVWIFSWLKSWFYGPTVTLHDCLAAFFSTDELKGDNMYSCEKCNKLRNGIKFSKVLQLPEILCIHLKRFRHELMFSSKISSVVTFPLKGLDMRPYLHADCTSKVSTYELFSVICHHGTAGGGHYTCFALNRGQWYEFDDQYVTKVTHEKVQACEAYVLFYRKSNKLSEDVRNKAEKILDETTNGLKKAYISRQWINKFYNCAEPGPIDNSDFLCHHGAINPDRYMNIEKIAFPVPYEVYDYLFKKFGGCPPLVDISICQACTALQKRLLLEMETFVQITKDAKNQDVPNSHYLSTSWYTQWQNFIQKTNQEPPGPIDNSKINLNNLDFNEAAEVPESLWIFFYNIYGGGPEIRIRPPPSVEEMETEEVGPDMLIMCDFEIPTQKKSKSNASLNGIASPEFVIPSLRKEKPLKTMIDRNLYGHGEPMETQNGPVEQVEEKLNGTRVVSNGAFLSEKSGEHKDLSNNSSNVDDDIDEDETEEIKNSKRYRRRRKNVEYIIL